MAQFKQQFAGKDCWSGRAGVSGSGACVGGARSCEEAHFVPGSISASVCPVPLQSQFISIKFIHGNDSVSALLVRSSRTVFSVFAGVKNLVLFFVFAVDHK